MSKPVAYCKVTGRGFAQWEVNTLKVEGAELFLCPCHSEPLIDQYPFTIDLSVHAPNSETFNTLSEGIHEMIAEHNSTPEKVFYYSEEEAKRLCRHAARGNFRFDTFDQWWESVKKK